MASPQKVIIGIVTEGRSDSALQACVSVLHLQMQLMQTPQNDAFHADFRFYKSNNEALEDLYRSKEMRGVFVINWSSGVPGAFSLKAFRSSNEVVLGVHSDGVIDWDRVRANIATAKESVEYAGINYNVELEGVPDDNKYAKVKSAKMMDVFFIKRSAVDRIASEHPEVVSKDGQHASFAVDGVYDGQYMHATERFLTLYGKTVYADVEHGINKLAPQDFTGVVGNRSRLR
ncbi:hypothetical protein ATCVMO0605SPH_423R [Acanthocystis turfacea Chlorella virus MO0605SPH]|nr:hypothetical protein ATCVMO0605SPH_423R [Acanthocystis turfacea Chlorella virus MO0605SPH]AGE60095.1 hypothetical protein ATCVWI0606_445R [Acanthocystis turfacea Chlorella virus WI0606]